MAPGEIFLQQVYEALTLNPDRWAKTLFVVTYDEHGGFFDHVIPPKVHHLPAYAKYTKAFTFAGPRVPALVASPHVAPRSVCHATLDHTSVLQLIAELFAGGPKNYSSDVSRRRAQGIQSLSVVLRPDGPGGLPPKMASRPVAVRSQVHTGVKAPSNPNQAAFALAGRALLKQDRSAALDRFPELAHLAEEGISEDG